jgi:homoserine O-acetyltransferase
MIQRRMLLAASLATPFLARIVAAQEAPLIVEKRAFDAGPYRTRGGGTIGNARIGYQTAGTLNAAGDNAVLITHFFSANGHAFGRYEATGAAGWWDAIIGPGKPIDTNRFFVVASDTLTNLNARDPRTITTGPATVNPETGRPYGMDFPVVSIRDFVEVQKKLLDHLGVRRLALVAGPSMGALQAVEWAAAYPQMVERAMPVIGTGHMDSWVITWLELWAAPIRRDPNWRNGDYYGAGREPPLRGLADALQLVTLHARAPADLGRFPPRGAEGQDPARRMDAAFAATKWLDDAGLARARTADANAFLYLVRANQLFLGEYESSAAALAGSRARWLVVPSLTDQVFPVGMSRTLVETLRGQGREAPLAELDGPLGHLEGVVSMAKVAEPIRRFLAA